ncbi:unnamed protein product [Pneumocystis jirovecii]|uniref:RRM domain-containing protein n=2 Tax=Pneumocystis jirovecii TaxID=42068 RepID=L0PB78_PNEJI|nr:uncharacterized protein T551_03130 [Pneumocystis jirovecii RU7]KTW27136.1 hypothetical protein T551_03130 [Pneumocystis jirovecii RU7]CCJ28865.1 unnamed protein product [Pneumocystis jirovecii]
MTSTSIEKAPVGSVNQQIFPSTATRPFTEDGRPLKCYVGNLSNQCRMYHLREKFSPFGTIINVELKPNIGCGFVEFVDPESCIKACHALDGTELFGQTLRVETQKQVYGVRKIVTEKLEGCFNCGAKNHWAKHCPKMPPPGTPQNVSPKSSILSSETHGPMKPPGNYDIYNYGYPRYYFEDMPYRQPCSNAYRNSYYYAQKDYFFRDRDIRDSKDFQKYRNRQWNPPPEKFSESASISYKRYLNTDPKVRENDRLVASSNDFESSEFKSKSAKSLNEDKSSKTQVDSSQAENVLKESEKDNVADKKLHNNQNSTSQDTSAVAKQEIYNQNTESSDNKKVALYQPIRKDHLPYAYCEPQYYDDYYNHQDYIYPESYDRPYLVPKYPNDTLPYDHYPSYTGRHAPLRMRSKYSDGYRYYPYSEHYAPYDTNYRNRKSMQHLDYAPNPRMDYAALNYSQGYSRRCSPSSNMYSQSYNYGYPCEYR